MGSFFSSSISASSSPIPILITGVSSGIGRGLCEVAASSGFLVFGTVRNESDGKELIEILPANSFIPILMDVQSEISIQSAFEIVQEKLSTMKNQKLFALVNNAGIAIGKPFELNEMKEYQSVIQTNLLGPMNVTKIFLPLIDRQRIYGRSIKNLNSPGEFAKIIQISSVGSEIASPFISSYCASKYGLDGFSYSLRQELFYSNIDVIVITAGSVKSEIWNKSASKPPGKSDGKVNEALIEPIIKNSKYEKSFEKFLELANQIAESGMTIQEAGKFLTNLLKMHGRSKANYLMVKGKFINWSIPSSLPRSWREKLLLKLYYLNSTAAINE